MRTIVALAGGNPAYLLAMAAAVEHHGQVRKWKAVPHSVAAVVLDHFGHLSVEAREVLRAMALLGDSCSVDEIMATTGARASDLVDVLAEALEVGALQESDDEVRFAHPLLRRVLYESVPVSLRLAVHQQRGFLARGTTRWPPRPRRAIVRSGRERGPLTRKHLRGQQRRPPRSRVEPRAGAGGSRWPWAREEIT